MKKFNSLLAFSFCLLTVSVSAQWTDVLNNGINYEFNIQDNWYGGDNDFDGQADPTIKTDVWLSTWGWIGESCHSWDCTSNCTNQGNSWAWWAGGTTFDAEFATWIRGYESDNSDECTWYTNDDQEWNGMGTLRDGATQQKLVYGSTDFRPCQWIPYLGNGGSGWLYPNSPHFDQIMRLTWRFAAGDESTWPLDFGTISSTTKFDINANRSVTTGSTVPLDYTNTSGQSSADVWYTFTINESSNVTISTDHGETDFDTYLTLYTVAGNYVTEDDDGGTGYTSVINRAMCPGTYLINMEGYSSNTGLYKITVTTSAAGAPTLNDWHEYPMTCTGSNDGGADWSIGGGVAPYTYTWDGTAVNGTYVGDLSVGNYTLVVTDACGNTHTEPYTIVHGDLTDPDANCKQDFDIDVVDGSTYNLITTNINDGSTDNCAVQSMSISPNTLDASDAGSNEITLTVTDTNGNVSTCSTSIHVNVLVGVEEIDLAENMKIYPNPNNGSFSIDLSNTIIDTNAKIEVFDPLGRIIYAEKAKQNLTTIDLQEATGGIYMLRLTNGHVQASKQISVIR